MLSCYCNDDMSGEPGAWWYYSPDDFTIFNKKRRKRCSSCNSLIDIGSECLEFRRERNPYTEMEERISGCEVPMAPLWMCSKCGETFLNLEDIGYCICPQDNMQECLSEYHELTGFKPGEDASMGKRAEAV